MKHRNKSSADRGSDSRLTWIVVVPSVAVAILGNHFFPGWGRTILISMAVFVGMAAIWQRFWKRWWFWVTILVLLAAHLLLISRVHDLLNSANILGMFTFGVAEGLGVAIVLSIPIYLFAKKEYPWNS